MQGTDLLTGILEMLDRGTLLRQAREAGKLFESAHGTDGPRSAEAESQAQMICKQLAMQVKAQIVREENQSSESSTLRGPDLNLEPQPDENSVDSQSMKGDSKKSWDNAVPCRRVDAKSKKHDPAINRSLDFSVKHFTPDQRSSNSKEVPGSGDASKFADVNATSVESFQHVKDLHDSSKSLGGQTSSGKISDLSESLATSKASGYDDSSNASQSLVSSDCIGVEAARETFSSDGSAVLASLQNLSKEEVKENESPDPSITPEKHEGPKRSKVGKEAPSRGVDAAIRPLDYSYFSIEHLESEEEDNDRWKQSLKMTDDESLDVEEELCGRSPRLHKRRNNDTVRPGTLDYSRFDDLEVSDGSDEERRSRSDVKHTAWKIAGVIDDIKEKDKTEAKAKANKAQMEGQVAAKEPQKNNTSNVVVEGMNKVTINFDKNGFKVPQPTQELDIEKAAPQNKAKQPISALQNSGPIGSEIAKKSTRATAKLSSESFATELQKEDSELGLDILD